MIVLVRNEQRDNDNDNGQDESTSKKRRSNHRESAPKPNQPKTNDEQQEKKQPAKKRGRPRVNENVRTEQGSTMATEQKQAPIEQQQPKKRRQTRKSVPAKTDEEQSGSDDDADAGAAVGAAAAAAADVNPIAECTIVQVEKMRKRNNRHEYLVTTTDGNAKWIGREIMITEYAQDLIAFFERITRFQ